MSVRRSIPISVLAAFCAACSASTQPSGQSGGGSGGTFVPAATVNATPSLAFAPAQVNLAVGGTVTFAFGGVGHNVFFDDDPAGAPANIAGVNANTSVQRTFPTAGVYTYFCHIHPGMQGTIIVGSSASTPTPPDSSSPGGYNLLK
jgi:plastocyanin